MLAPWPCRHMRLGLGLALAAPPQSRRQCSRQPLTFPVACSSSLLFGAAASPGASAMLSYQ